MKYLSLALLTTLFSMSFANGAKAEKHLFILSGQSNMARLDPGISFIPVVEAEFGKHQVIVVKDALSGQPIRRWYKKWKPAQGDIPKATGDLYQRLLKKFKVASKGERLITVTLVWMQGEQDAREKHGEVYAASVKGLIDQLAKDLGKKQINYVLGRLSDFDMSDKKSPHWTMIPTAQVELAKASPRGAWVNTDDLNDGRNEQGKRIKNDLHYSVEGYKILGERFAEKAIELIKSAGER